jgi:hypothetical protein
MLSRKSRAFNPNGFLPSRNPAHVAKTTCTSESIARVTNLTHKNITIHFIRLPKSTLRSQSNKSILLNMSFAAKAAGINAFAPGKEGILGEFPHVEHSNELSLKLCSFPLSCFHNLSRLHSSRHTNATTQLAQANHHEQLCLARP